MIMSDYLAFLGLALGVVLCELANYRAFVRMDDRISELERRQ
jgi:hypothetical protein